MVRLHALVLPTGQYRAMQHGINGKYDVVGNVESITYTADRAAYGSNPPLSAILIRIKYLFALISVALASFVTPENPVC